MFSVLSTACFGSRIYRKCTGEIGGNFDEMLYLNSAEKLLKKILFFVNYVKLRMILRNIITVLVPSIVANLEYLFSDDRIKNKQ